MKTESGVLDQTIYIENCLSHPLPEVHDIENTASDKLRSVYEQKRQQERYEDQRTYALSAESNDPCVWNPACWWEFHLTFPNCGDWCQQ